MRGAVAAHRQVPGQPQGRLWNGASLQELVQQGVSICGDNRPQHAQGRVSPQQDQNGPVPLQRSRVATPAEPRCSRAFLLYHRCDTHRCDLCEVQHRWPDSGHLRLWPYFC